MTRRVVWRDPRDGRTHEAVLSGDHTVATSCGLTAEAPSGELRAGGEVTCPACRTEQRLAALAKLTAA